MNPDEQILILEREVAAERALADALMIAYARLYKSVYRPDDNLLDDFHDLEDRYREARQR